MVSFQRRFAAGLEKKGIESTRNLSGEFDSVLVIGGTSDIYSLWRVKKRGARIVQRLNGMNWLHRKLKTGVRHVVKAEYGNLILQLVRTRFADHIVYQSNFAKQWWERTHGFIQTTDSVVYNAVDLNTFSPLANNSENSKINLEHFRKPEDKFRILMVEGSLMGGYEIGLKTGLELVSALNNSYGHQIDKPVELVVVGKVSEKLKKRLTSGTQIPVIWGGIAKPEHIPKIDASAHLFYSADLNAACPNAVIEALACGTPVLGFDTGALPELVTSQAGQIVPYRENPWLLEEPDIQGLCKGAVELLRQQDGYREGARRRAEEAFGLGNMVDNYLDALNLGY
jgi:glycosyltransferase involved in cell wall biosynthesis